MATIKSNDFPNTSVKFVLCFFLLIFSTAVLSQSIDKELLKAAKKGDDSAQVKVGGIFYYAENYERAYYWYKKASKKMNKSALFNLGVLYLNGYGVTKDYSEAYKYFIMAADMGIVNAQLILGELYYKGEGVSQDFSRAYYWYEKAATQDLAEAQLMLGVMYSRGEGVSQDKSEANKWFEISANQGNKKAQFILGLLYEDDNNYVEAYKWYKESADQDFAMAQYNLGELYYFGQGVSQDFSKAYYWYEKAANQDYEDAQCDLGYLYLNGEGVPRDFTKARYWYEKAADKGNLDALYNLGALYQNGQGVPQNYSKAITYYEKSAIDGNVDSQYSLGLLYELGNGVPKNLSEAYKWYKMAAEQGEEDAKKRMENLRKMINQEIVNNNIPIVKWLSHESTTEQKKYSFKLGVKSDSKIEEVNVYVNGNLVSDRGIIPVANDGFSLTIEKTITLSSGKNTIKVTVKNACGTASTEKNVTYTTRTEFYPLIKERRIALVIGNSKYKGNMGVLENPRHDAEDISKKLKALGFEVTSLYDGSLKQMNDAIEKFVGDAQYNDVALFYYAGHGMQLQTDIGGANYLIPVNAQIIYKCDVEDCIKANRIVSQLENSGCKIRLIVLDACRNLPNIKDCHRGVSREGYSEMESAVGTYIMYSTREGHTADDGKGRNSPFAEAILQYIDQPNLPLESFFKKVGELVDEKTNFRQAPWQSGRIRGEFYFNKNNGYGNEYN